MEIGIAQSSWENKSQTCSFDNQINWGDHARVMGTRPTKRSKNDPQAATLRLIRIAAVGDHHGAQTEMADLIGVGTNAYNNWENGYKIPEHAIDLICARWPYIKPEFIRRQETDRMTPAALEWLGIISPKGGSISPAALEWLAIIRPQAPRGSPTRQRP